MNNSIYDILIKKAEDIPDPTPLTKSQLNKDDKKPIATNPATKTKGKATKPVSNQFSGSENVKILQRNILEYKDSLLNMDIGKVDSGRYTSNQQEMGSQYSPGWEHEENVKDTFYQNQKETDLGRRQSRSSEGKEVVGGTNPIGNFLLSNFIPKISLEFADLDASDKDRLNTQSGGMARQPNDFRQLIDTIGRVGTPKLDRPKDKNEEKLEQDLNTIKSKYKDSNSKEFIALSKKYNETLAKSNKGRQQAHGKDINGKDLDKYEYKLTPENLTNDILLWYDNSYKAKSNQLAALKLRLDKEYEKKHPKVQGEETIDGIFRIRTENALKTIGAITKGFLDFGKALNKEFSFKEAQLKQYNDYIKFFNETKIKKLKKAPIDNNKVQELIDRLSSLVGQQVEFLGEFKQVVENSNVKDFINQNNSFMQISKSTQAPSEQKQKQQAIESVRNSVPENYSKENIMQFLQQYQKYNFFTAHVANVTIPLSFDDLSSVDKLKDVFVRALKVQPSKDQLVWFFNQIKTQINADKNYQAFLSSIKSNEDLKSDNRFNTESFGSPKQNKLNTDLESGLSKYRDKQDDSYNNAKGVQESNRKYYQ